MYDRCLPNISEEPQVFDLDIFLENFSPDTQRCFKIAFMLKYPLVDIPEPETSPIVANLFAIENLLFLVSHFNDSFKSEVEKLNNINKVALFLKLLDSKSFNYFNIQEDIKLINNIIKEVKQYSKEDVEKFVVGEKDLTFKALGAKFLNLDFNIPSYLDNANIKCLGNYIVFDDLLSYISNSVFNDFLSLQDNHGMDEGSIKILRRAFVVQYSKSFLFNTINRTEKQLYALYSELQYDHLQLNLPFIVANEPSFVLDNLVQVLKKVKGLDAFSGDWVNSIEIFKLLSKLDIRKVDRFVIEFIKKLNCEEIRVFCYSGLINNPSISEILDKNIQYNCCLVGADLYYHFPETIRDNSFLILKPSESKRHIEIKPYIVATSTEGAKKEEVNSLQTREKEKVVSHKKTRSNLTILRKTPSPNMTESSLSTRELKEFLRKNTYKLKGMLSNDKASFVFEGKVAISYDDNNKSFRATSNSYPFEKLGDFTFSRDGILSLKATEGVAPKKKQSFREFFESANVSSEKKQDKVSDAMQGLGVKSVLKKHSKNLDKVKSKKQVSFNIPEEEKTTIETSGLIGTKAHSIAPKGKFFGLFNKILSSEESQKNLTQEIVETKEKEIAETKEKDENVFIDKDVSGELVLSNDDVAEVKGMYDDVDKIEDKEEIKDISFEVEEADEVEEAEDELVKKITKEKQEKKSPKEKTQPKIKLKQNKKPVKPKVDTKNKTKNKVDLQVFETPKPTKPVVQAKPVVKKQTPEEKLFEYIDGLILSHESLNKEDLEKKLKLKISEICGQCNIINDNLLKKVESKFTGSFKDKFLNIGFELRAYDDVSLSTSLEKSKDKLPSLAMKTAPIVDELGGLIFNERPLDEATKVTPITDPALLKIADLFFNIIDSLIGSKKSQDKLTNNTFNLIFGTNLLLDEHKAVILKKCLTNEVFKTNTITSPDLLKIISSLPDGSIGDKQLLNIIKILKGELSLNDGFIGLFLFNKQKITNKSLCNEAIGRYLKKITFPVVGEMVLGSINSLFCFLDKCSVGSIDKSSNIEALFKVCCFNSLGKAFFDSYSDKFKNLSLKQLESIIEKVDVKEVEKDALVNFINSKLEDAAKKLDKVNKIKGQKCLDSIIEKHYSSSSTMEKHYSSSSTMETRGALSSFLAGFNEDEKVELDGMMKTLKKIKEDGRLNSFRCLELIDSSVHKERIADVNWESSAIGNVIDRLLYVYKGICDYESVIGIIESMRKDKIKLSKGHYSTLISAYAFADKINELLEISDEAEREEKLDKQVCWELIRFFGLQRKFDNAAALIKNLKDLGEIYKADIFEEVIGVCIEALEYDIAIKTIEHAKENKVELTEKIYLDLIFSYLAKVNTKEEGLNFEKALDAGREARDKGYEKCAEVLAGYTETLRQTLKVSDSEIERVAFRKKIEILEKEFIPTKATTKVLSYFFSK